jgi:hypothetical protein
MSMRKSGKSMRYNFHTFHNLKKKFHTFIQQFHTLWKLFLLHTVLSFHTKHKHFVPWAWYFIPSGQVFIPHATNFILIISFSTLLITRLIVCIHSFTTERTSHVCGCFLWPNYVAQSSSAPTGWLWPAPTAPTCQASDALEPGSQAWSRLVSVLHAWTANSGAHTSFCVCTTSERRRHSLRPADHNRACTPLQQVLVTVSPTKTNAHAHPSLRSHPSGHGEFNITSLTSGQCCLRSSTSLARWPLCGNITQRESLRLAVVKHTARHIPHACIWDVLSSWFQQFCILAPSDRHTHAPRAEPSAWQHILSTHCTK